MFNNTSSFREINVGNIPPGIIYRSSHPICDGKQVKDIILLANKVKIKTIINLSENINSLKIKKTCCPWYNNLIKDDNVIALNIKKYNNIMDKTFIKKIKQCILFIIKHESPYLIHCEAGIDRTGFLSLILETLMEATFDDIVKDYMLSFIDKDEYSKRDYLEGSIIIKNIYEIIKGELVNSNENIKEIIEKYLIKYIGLNENILRCLENKLMNKEKYHNVA